MTTATIELAPITAETDRLARRWLKAEDGGAPLLRDAGRYDEDGYSVNDMLPNGTEKVERIAEVLAYAQHEKGKTFSMDSWHIGPAVIKTETEPPPLDCGTTCCLAGTAVAFYMPVGWKMEGGTVFKPAKIGRARLHVSWAQAIDTARLGREVLGLSHSQAEVLFYMTDAHFSTIQKIASLMTGYELTGDLSRFLPKLKGN